MHTITSRSGKIYSGPTRKDAERKYLLASLHAADKELGFLHDVCAQMFSGIYSFGDLSVDQMRQLYRTVSDARISGNKLKQEATRSLEPKATTKQIKRLIKIGKYSSVAETYGAEFFWKRTKEFIPRFKNSRVDLSELSNAEAFYLIRRFEQIEKKLLLKGVYDNE